MPSEKFYQKQFLNFIKTVPNNSYLYGSQFIEEVPLRYDTENSVARGEDIKFMPDYRADIIEIDSELNLHLWEAKLLHADDLLKGKIIGQLLFYDFLFSTNPISSNIDILRAKGIDETILNELAKKDSLDFKTWNILICGGQGYEISAGVNPIIWTYVGGLERYLNEGFIVDTWHFYETQEKYDLKNIWDLSIYKPELLHPDAYQAFLDSKNMTEEDWEGIIFQEQWEDAVFNFLESLGIKEEEKENILEAFYNYEEDEIQKNYLESIGIDIEYANNIIVESITKIREETRVIFTRSRFPYCPISERPE
ncbi:hypothetical protein H6G54_08020 [Anabaena cylindrica FACHB-243]|uniref:Uncharacterized protein n=1 Tax=Anabaena cylindrica (strain ATCC 27899 / PCC 7122) TaxID=272123 RepID=K9ZP46_ANACC|nr:MULTISPECIES: hypothetical protein [Anabaena]AFZ60297.1 hypothetical protein Anacy_4957 [Anabaena cylindrica PCC 7122]MBD2417651.1 hypothetical protein [Anabaena cylindrica FACHB-243]MBY5282044.1 hypothetical protein [Anabaena sp. CCAP 1446/1C]MBY5308882.1 hypothetical protein [Anabaena sp. CCAP 1446/1C]MCM2404566.1 hypothetical protein [Anabaena sp. CCAP 1446/1C]